MLSPSEVHHIIHTQKPPTTHFFTGRLNWAQSFTWALQFWQQNFDFILHLQRGVTFILDPVLQKSLCLYVITFFFFKVWSETFCVEPAMKFDLAVCISHSNTSLGNLLAAKSASGQPRCHLLTNCCYPNERIALRGQLLIRHHFFNLLLLLNWSQHLTNGIDLFTLLRIHWQFLPFRIKVRAGRRTGSGWRIWSRVRVVICINSWQPWLLDVLITVHSEQVWFHSLCHAFNKEVRAFRFVSFHSWRFSVCICGSSLFSVSFQSKRQIVIFWLWFFLSMICIQWYGHAPCHWYPDWDLWGSFGKYWRIL